MAIIPKKAARQSKVSNVTPLRQSKSNQDHFLILYYPPDSSIEPSDVYSLISQLDLIKKGDRKKINLHMLIHSSGGDAYSAFKMANCIRDYCKTLTAVIPERAMSAATLITLASDRLIMGHQSQIGPLDQPIEHPVSESVYISSLDYIRPIAYLEGVLRSFTKNRFEDIRNEVGLGRKDSIKLALDAGLEFIKPLMTQLDPLQISKSQRGLDIANKYGVNLLTKYMLKSNQYPAVSSKAKATVEKLIYNYPAHSFAICLEEAQSIGLKAENPLKYPHWNDMISVYKRMITRKTKTIWTLDPNYWNEWAK